LTAGTRADPLQLRGCLIRFFPVPFSRFFQETAYPEATLRKCCGQEVRAKAVVCCYVMWRGSAS
jgi:hypothetical protein